MVEVSHQQWPYIWDFNNVEVMAEGARRSGKSFALAPKATISALYHPHKKGGLLGPTYRQIGNAWSHILKITPRHWLLPGNLGRNDTKKILRYINGVTVIMLHAYKDDASRSEGVAWWGIDERQDVGEGAWTNALLSTSEGGDNFHLFETATIKESLREHHDKLEAAPDCAIYRMDMQGNPFISKKLYAFASGMLDKAARERELEAKWPELVGRCYHPFDYEDGGHIREAPALDATGQPLEDITAAYCAEEFETPSWGENAARHIIGVDPPHHAGIYKMYRGNVLHQIDEVIVGLDGLKGDVRDLARQCWERYPGGVVIRDPHDTNSSGQGGKKGSHDCDRYFRAQGYRMSRVKKAGVEYQLTAVRARLERDKLFVAPRCRHTIECYKLQTYTSGKGRRAPDKTLKSKITPHFTVDHAGDMTRYLVYKLFPPMEGRDYERREEVAG